jgi:hypothetical protein
VPKTEIVLGFGELSIIFVLPLDPLPFRNRATFAAKGSTPPLTIGLKKPTGKVNMIKPQLI